MKLKFLKERVIKALFIKDNQDIRCYVARIIADVTGEPYEYLKDNLELIHIPFEDNDDCCLSFYDGKNFYGFDIDYHDKKYYNNRVFAHGCSLFNEQFNLPNIDCIKPVKVISLCTRFKSSFSSDKIVHEFSLRDSSNGELKDDSLIIYDIDLLNYKNLDFDSIIKNKVLNDLMVLVTSDNDMIYKVCKDNKEALAFMDILKRVKSPYLSLEDLEEFYEVHEVLDV